MEITKEEIENRKAKLQADYQQAIATAQAIGGAIQDCDYWLARLTESAEEKQD